MDSIDDDRFVIDSKFCFIYKGQLINTSALTVEP